MKQIWLWIIFILAYGLFSMKSHAAVADAATHFVHMKVDHPSGSTGLGR